MSYNSFLYFSKHIKENKLFYRFFFKINKTFPLEDGFEEMWEPILIPYYHSIGIYDEKIMLLRFVCFQAGFTNALGKWVENDCNITCEEMAKVLKECIIL